MKVIWRDWDTVHRFDKTTDLDGVCGKHTIRVIRSDSDENWAVKIDGVFVVNGTKRYCLRRDAKHYVEDYFRQKGLDRKDSIKTEALIKIEETVMLYGNDPRYAMEIIQSIAESALEQSR